MNRWIPAALAIGCFICLPSMPRVIATAGTVPQQAPDALCRIYLDPHDKFTSVVPSAAAMQAWDQEAHANAVLVTVNYTGFTPEAQTAFQAAVDIWKDHLNSSVPIVIDASFADLSASNPFLLGQVGPYFTRNSSGLPRSSTWFPLAIANAFAGADVFPALPDIVATFNSVPPVPWYYSTDGLTPSGQVDFESVVLHELGHGLGFVGSANYSAGSGAYGLNAPPANPLVYDAFVVDGGGANLVANYPNNSVQLGSLLISNNLFWDGPAGKAANGGVRPRLYAPATWAGGSSFSHLNEATYGPGNQNSLMTPMIGTAEAVHVPGPIVLGTFRDMGWTTAVTVPPCTFSLSSASASLPATAASGSVTLTASGGSCAWTAVTNAAFLTVTSVSSGTGSATIAYAAAANTSTNARRGSLTIGGLTVAVTQAGRPASRRIVAGDFDGDGRSDLTVFRPDTGTWFTQGQATSTWGSAGDVPLSGDFDGDGVADLGVYRPANGVWYLPALGAIVWGAPGDIPVPADYNGDGTTDIAVFRPSTGMWYVRDGISAAWGRAGDIPVAADFNGDGRADVAVYRPATGTWYVRDGATIVWGLAADVPVPGDFNGDGRADIAVFRPSTGEWLVYNQFTQTWGAAGDIPVLLDRSGDGVPELGVFRRATGVWYFANRITGINETIGWGRTGDVPIGASLTVPRRARAGDYEGDGVANLTVFRPSTGDWVAQRSVTGGADYILRTFGLSGDVPVGRDYDGDGTYDFAVFRPATNTWYVLLSSTDFASYVTQVFGVAGDVPVPGDYDGDGKADYAVFRPSEGRWYVLLSSSSNITTLTIDWGLAGDTPVPADYDGDGRIDPAVFRASTGRWYILNRLLGSSTVYDWGLTGDRPTAADFDGDGKADITVFRPTEGRWFIKSSIDGSCQVADWGVVEDDVVPADYDSDGKADVAVFRPSTGMWYVRGLFSRSWGLAGDNAALKMP